MLEKTKFTPMKNKKKKKKKKKQSEVQLLNDFDYSGFEDIELYALEQMDISSIPLLPSPVCPRDILDSVVCEQQATSEQNILCLVM